MTISMTASEAMLSRHSVRKYVPNTPIAATELNEILELAASAPSSWNLQHWRFLVFQQEETKQKLLPISYNQQQVVDCSAVIAVLGDTQANLMAPELYGEQLQAGNITQQVHDTLVGNINRAYESSAQLGTEEAIRNGSLASMQLMLAAKAKGWDTCPMGGFNKEQFVTEFNIPSRYVPVMLITLGKAAAPAHATSRLPLERTVFHETFPANQ
ncbi:nitroreductase family protein [Paenibacillus alvei]|uniref:Nitroreductase family protein n=1 Tax=Paenibacillus alvei TaxID=44250 RepID=A0ABT4H1A9_PAEAL|nr:MULTISPECIES: nitroreductase family protein [Paenibacillus]EJW15494.1 putative NAD(P)H nitroreductase YodC [Paenibacillus alvei DSM 29]MCY7488124.1 nitroreductase family protein [Paenibacillus alvei]MCY9542487.1 nitroreductase family protein [Paenibacillus alvei]MCY9706624.1 nitroreductase family protein [Paenibacillus alvei]MCY9736594.1 nitroreductase family protein [Paenibacillus alvei]